MSLQVMPAGERKNAFLVQEATSVHAVCNELEENINKLIGQLQGLLVVREALDAQITLAGLEPIQLELPFNPDNVIDFGAAK